MEMELHLKLLVYSVIWIILLNPEHNTLDLSKLILMAHYEYSKTIEVDLGLPKQFSLSQNHPNPFNPSTKIEFSLPIEAQVTIKLFNSIGEEVSEIVNRNYSGGVHEVFFNARNISSGIYFYTIDANGADGSNFIASKKMILLR
jgi:hypothetical protein